MKITNIEDKNLKKMYLNFLYKIYKGDNNFVDTSIFIVKTFLEKSDSFSNECYIRPIAVFENDNIVAECMYIYHKDLPYFQIGFFEALPNQEKAVDMILKQAETIARELGLNKIIIGLNGHVSYGVGILCNGFDKKASFDSIYNKSYYKEYFDKYNFETKTLSTYYTIISNKLAKLKCLERIYKKISFRKMDMHKFKDEIILLGNLCNTCLKDTYLYYNRAPVFLFELINDMKAFLKPENLIFAMKDGVEIGFLFWHPDYNEILQTGKKNSIFKIGVDYFFKRKSIQTIKINVIGVIEKYQKTGAAIGLLNECYKYSKKQYKYALTNFVWDNNIKSTLLNQSICSSKDRNYCVYIKNI